MRQLFFGAYTFAATMLTIICAAQQEFAYAFMALGCAGVGAVALTKGERY